MSSSARGAPVLPSASVQAPWQWRNGEIESASQRFPTRVIEVIAGPQILAERLAGRGRENAGDISARLARTVALPANVPVETVRNNTRLEAALGCFLAALNRAAEFSRKS